MIEYEIYRFEATGVYGYLFLKDGGKIGDCTSAPLLSSPVFIHAGRNAFVSEFDSGQTIIPGLTRIIIGTEGYHGETHLIYRSRQWYTLKYEAMEFSIHIVEGGYEFRDARGLIAELRRASSNVPLCGEDYYDTQLAFQASVHDRCDEELTTLIRSCPILQFVFLF